jgi:serine protease Do
MDCPKCGHNQSNTVKCESCGVYFSKLTQPGVAATPVTAFEASSRAPSVGALVLVAVLAGGGVYYLMRASHEQRAPAAVAAIASEAAATAGIPAASSTLAPAASVTDAIGAARSATVFIRTAWGLGSGFIVDSDCHVVTNRHVVETDGARVAANLDRTPEMQAGIAVTQKSLQSAIAAAQLHRHVLAGQPGNNLEVIQLDSQIRDMQQILANLPQQVDADINRRVSDADKSGFSVSLLDGTRYDGLTARLSEHSDLAVFQLPATYCSFIAADPTATLKVGQRVYTIGNPSGLAYTVTSGVLSGLREMDGTTYLQTDAPINPGNSGGPLITEQGRVVGINSSVMRGVQGIGFALPIEAVYSAFPEMAPAR